MSVLIKGMEVPKNCDVCPLIAEADDYHVCYINEQFIPWEWIDEHSAEQRHPKPSWCPLVPADVVERKRGEWFDRGSLSCRCSNCGCKSTKEYSFCPNCGADMRGRKDDRGQS